MATLDFSRLVSPQNQSDPISTSPVVLKPTAQQSAFLDTLLNTSSNITLQARAGCGKTSAILMGVDAYLSRFHSHEILVCAYNKSIQTEVEAKLKTRGYDWRQVGCQTVHGMGMGLVKFVYKSQVDEKKVWNIIRQLRDSEPSTSPLWVFPSQILSLVSMAKQAGVGFFDNLPISDVQTWLSLASHFDIDFDGADNAEAIVAWSQRIYRLSLEIVDTIDFDDMILFPLIKSLRVKYTKDLVLGDEFQDWSRARQALVRKFVRLGGGRMVVVGDDRQAIYGFSGADAKAMENFTRELDAVVLPLSVTWRCPKAVVKLAQGIVPDIEAARIAPEGSVLRQDELIMRAEFEDKYEDENGEYKVLRAQQDILAALEQEKAFPPIFVDNLTPGRDVILCRNNAPLVPLAYKLIRAGIPAKVEGRKIGEGLSALVTRWQCRSTADLLARLQVYREREVQKYLSKFQEDKAQEVDDRVDTLRCIIEEVNHRGKRDIQSVLDFINSLFADGAKECVTLATYHRSKGREWDRVFLLEHGSRCPSRAARQTWQKEQEANLAYVAFTRAKSTLIFVG